VSRQNVVHPQNERLGEQLDSDCSDKILAMIVPLRHLLWWMVSAFSSREDLILENLALRQQLLALHAKRPRRRRHLKRLMSEYVSYYHEDRTHLGLAKDTPAGRPIAIRFGAESKIQSLPRLGGLHHRYAVAA
jgi:hypothetical protein